jgi:hypothetical protein
MLMLMFMLLSTCNRPIALSFGYPDNCPDFILTLHPQGEEGGLSSEKYYRLSSNDGDGWFLLRGDDQNSAYGMVVWECVTVAVSLEFETWGRQLQQMQQQNDNSLPDWVRFLFGKKRRLTFRGANFDCAEMSAEMPNTEQQQLQEWERNQYEQAQKDTAFGVAKLRTCSHLILIPQQHNPSNSEKRWDSCDNSWESQGRGHVS